MSSAFLFRGDNHRTLVSTNLVYRSCPFGVGMGRGVNRFFRLFLSSPFPHLLPPNPPLTHMHTLTLKPMRLSDWHLGPQRNVRVFGYRLKETSHFRVLIW